MPRMTNSLLRNPVDFHALVLLSEGPLGAWDGERTSGLLGISSLPKACGWLISF